MNKAHIFIYMFKMDGEQRKLKQFLIYTSFNLKNYYFIP